MSADIFEAFYSLHHAFRAQNMKPPTAINLASPEEGERFLKCVLQSDRFRYFLVAAPRFGRDFVELADGSVYRELDFMGIKVRWPANKRATPDGSWSWE